VSGPLNPNELMLSTQWAELQESVQECSSDYLSQTYAKMSEIVLPFVFKPESDKDGDKEVPICRMQQSISEWLVDEFM